MYHINTMIANITAQKLTSRQKEVLEIIKKSFADKNSAPTIREIAIALDLHPKKSSRAVVKHLNALEKKGFIIRSSQDRGIQIVGDQSTDGDFIQIPLLGFANAGTPLVVAEEENLGTLQIEKSIARSRTNIFAVQIAGDSMNLQKASNGVFLSNGNYALIDKDGDPSSEKTVLAIINGCATIKNLVKEDNMIILNPNSDNPINQPIYIESDENTYVNGTVFGALNKPIQ